MGKGRGPDCCGACSCGICCAVFVLKPQTGKRRTLTRDDDALSVQLDPEDYDKLMRKCEEKGRLKVKMKGHLKQRRAQSGEAKKKTRVISQWENVNCAEVFP